MKPLKTINDPIHGFIVIKDELVLQLVAHPYFQRLRRIKQLGVSDFVYPAAQHTRFHHTLGAMCLMERALDILRQKGHSISDDEYRAALIAILLHDVGHGPFSHVLEYTLLQEVRHEQVSRWIMEKLNAEYGGALALAIQIFEDKYPRKFLHQLVSSQLDVDRLDYLQRDSFFTGVQEGQIGGKRILNLLDVQNGELCLEQKGIYSIENFLNARRLMYWQVYLYKTNVAAEQMLIRVIERARYLLGKGEAVQASPAFLTFLGESLTWEKFKREEIYFQHFLQLDDYDIWAALKAWQFHEDRILAILSRMILNRQLFRAELSPEAPEREVLAQKKKEIQEALQLKKTQVKYFFSTGTLSNAAYLSEQQIKIKFKDGSLRDIAQASDLPNIKALTRVVKKYFVSYIRL